MRSRDRIRGFIGRSAFRTGAYQALGTAFETCTLQTRTAFIFFFVIKCISSDGFADDRRPISSHVST